VRLAQRPWQSRRDKDGARGRFGGQEMARAGSGGVRGWSEAVAVSNWVMVQGRQPILRWQEAWPTSALNRGKRWRGWRLLLWF
jgi:hypothetical protein